jgi:hypothetical protein
MVTPKFASSGKGPGKLAAGLIKIRKMVEDAEDTVHEAQRAIDLLVSIANDPQYYEKEAKELGLL